MSGDLTVVMGEMQQIPEWFQEGKIHRFDGPEEGVRLYKGSQSLSKGIKVRSSNAIPAASHVAAKAHGDSSRQQDNRNHKKEHQPSSSGCGALLFLLGTAFGLGATTLSFWG